MKHLIEKIMADYRDKPLRIEPRPVFLWPFSWPTQHYYRVIARQFFGRTVGNQMAREQMAHVRAMRSAR